MIVKDYSPDYILIKKLLKYINPSILRVNTYLVEELDGDNTPISKVEAQLIEESDGNTEDILWID